VTVLAFPGVERPAFPGISVEIPDHWFSVHVPDTVLAATAPPLAGSFTVNVLVSVTRLSQDHVLQTSVEGLHARSAGLAEVAWGEEATSAAGDRAVYAGELSYVDPAAGTVLQTHRLVLLDRGPVRDLVHAVGSCSAQQVAESLPDLRKILGSLEIAL